MNITDGYQEVNNNEISHENSDTLDTTLCEEEEIELAEIFEVEGIKLSDEELIELEENEIEPIVSRPERYIKVRRKI